MNESIRHLNLIEWPCILHAFCMHRLNYLLLDLGSLSSYSLVQTILFKDRHLSEHKKTKIGKISWNDNTVSVGVHKGDMVTWNIQKSRNECRLRKCAGEFKWSAEKSLRCTL